MSSSAQHVIEREGLLGTVGNTPIIPLQHLHSGAVEIYAKAEWHNPSGSVKDRPAAAILREALQSGELGNGRSLLDSTSGNMGIAYATLAAAIGVPVHLTLPANANNARKGILHALGTQLTLTDPLEGSDGARHVAAAIAAQHPDRYYYADQYSNPTNWRAHFETTGPEILRDTEGRITHFVAGLGTTGTVVGTGRYLREAAPGVQIIAFQPEGPLHGLEGLKNLTSSEVPEIFDPLVPDETLDVKTEDAYAMARRLAREEGLLVGPSSAAAAVAALALAERMDTGLIVTIFADSGLKYLDQPFWNEP
ncbi:MAG: PLP-dependent cysteine synthase family protein [Chloroflexi bacterium]|nr:PLP-dependent cysteine synthase family protein [Chloroflexota bacterium]